MLSCKEFDEFMIDYLEENLPIWKKYMCWVHVKMCRDCAFFVQQYHRIVALGQKAFDSPDAPVPDSVPEDLVKAALAHRKAM